MKRLLPVLDLDVVIEHAGNKVAIKGSGNRFVAKFPSLWSLVHFGFSAWPFRKLMPAGCEFQIEWRRRRFPSGAAFSKVKDITLKP